MGAMNEHVPVLLKEVAAWLCPTPQGLFVDCTIGLGSHSKKLLEENRDLRVIGLDVDPANLDAARQNLGPLAERATLVHANFAEIRQVLDQIGIERVGGLLADLGFSSNQMSDPARGLSFDADGPLDMRLDPRLQQTAADLVNSLGEGELADLLYFQSQERHSRRIAKRICQARRQGRLNSTVLLARLVAAAVGAGPGPTRRRIHPATRTFMALRMAVNKEVESLRALLAAASSVVQPGGRVAIISFHSVEDGIVKDDFRTQASEGRYRVLTKKPITAGDFEIARNPRSRSAKLRVAEVVAQA